MSVTSLAPPAPEVMDGDPIPVVQSYFTVVATRAVSMLLLERVTASLDVKSKVLLTRLIKSIYMDV